MHRKYCFGSCSWSKIIPTAFIVIFAGAVAGFLFSSAAYAQEGAITGYKFYDVNGNGVKDEGEPGIGDWEISLVGEGDTETDGDGYYTFEVPGDGTYAVCERAYNNWTQTYPTSTTSGAVDCDELDEDYAPWGWSVEIDENGEIVDGPKSFDFGNTTQLGTIRAIKFNDLNDNRKRDVGEPGVEDVRIRIDDYESEDDFLQNLYDFFFPEDFLWNKDTNGDGVAEWTGLPAGRYELEEDEESIPEGWRATTQTGQAVDLDPGETEEVMFGNKQAGIVVYKYKYDYDSEVLIAGWEICLYKAVPVEGEGGYAPGDLVECKDTIDDFDEENDEEPGRFHGAAVFYIDDPESDTPYIIDEEEKEGWRLEDWGGSYDDVVNSEFGQLLVRINDDFVEGRDLSVELYNLKFTGDITALKYLGESNDFPVRGWEICLLPVVEEGEPKPDCKETDANGTVSWQNVLPGGYILDEEERAGWERLGFGGGEGEFNEELGQVLVSVEEGGNVVIYFYNWIKDETPPTSSFNDPMEHRVINTELVVLELSGTSIDIPLPPEIEGEVSGSSGIHNATLTVRQLGGPEAVGDYPSKSFFDVFLDLRCPESESIPIEIVSLSLTSVNPITVTWSRNWTPPSLGIYCFEARAADNAGNPEETGYAGPVAYVPVAQITEESTSVTPPTQTSFTVTWTTDKPATSRVIYDIESHPDPLLGEEPNYGYAFSTEEDPEKVFEHSVTVTGLTPGTTYYYRTVSKASPASVGPQGSVTTSSPPPPAASGGGGAALPPRQQCEDGVDNDGDGLLDMNDPGCVSPSDPSEVNPIPSPTPVPSPTVLGAGVQEPEPSPTPQGQVLGAATSLEDQIAALKAEIARLKFHLISLIRLRIGELQKQLAALLLQQH